MKILWLVSLSIIGCMRSTSALAGPSLFRLTKFSTPSPPLLDCGASDNPTTSSALFGTKGGATVSSSNLNKLITAITGALGVIASAIVDLTSLQKLLFVGVFCVGYAVGKAKPFWRAFRDVNDIPGSYFGANAPILRGRAVSVSDGDTIRFYHTPFPHRFDPNKKIKVSEVALPIRICTIDTPETAKFGKPGQPFGQEAKEVLAGLLENKIVKIRMLQKDQYSRAVAQVYVDGWFRKTFVDQYMLEKGMAEVYEGGGAVYGLLGKDKYMQMQEEARSKKLGIWSQGKRESAAEYKKRTKK